MILIPLDKLEHTCYNNQEFPFHITSRKGFVSFHFLETNQAQFSQTVPATVTAAACAIAASANLVCHCQTREFLTPVLDRWYTGNRCC